MNLEIRMYFEIRMLIHLYNLILQLQHIFIRDRCAGPVGAYIGNSSRVVTVAADVELKEGMVITDG